MPLRVLLYLFYRCSYMKNYGSCVTIKVGPDGLPCGPAAAVEMDPGQRIIAAETATSAGQVSLRALIEAADVIRATPEWQERASCPQTDPEAFFPEKGGSTREAKRICSRCEVKAECEEYALTSNQRFGIWGGLSERERRKRLRRVA